jgi:hypothetical protein
MPIIGICISNLKSCKTMFCFHYPRMMKFSDIPRVHMPKDVNPESDDSSDDDIPLSQYSPEKGKKRGPKAPKKPPVSCCSSNCKI